MTVESLASQVRSLETQLAVVKAQLAQIGTGSPHGTFGDLYGVLAGAPAVSEKELDSAKYSFEWQGNVEG
jgi:hypothetical protein